MKKKDLLKLAIIGLASGACIASQNTASDDLDLNSVVAMTKCTKDKKNDRGMDRDTDRSSCSGSGSCGSDGGDGSSCGSSCDGCDSGRKATRNQIFGREEASDKQMGEKRCGKFY